MGFLSSISVDRSYTLDTTVMLRNNVNKSFSSLHFPFFTRRRKWFKSGESQNYPAAEVTARHRLDKDIVFDVIMTTIDMDC